MIKPGVHNDAIILAELVTLSEQFEIQLYRPVL
jgi:hypothetical protein